MGTIGGITVLQDNRKDGYLARESKAEEYPGQNCQWSCISKEPRKRWKNLEEPEKLESFA